MLPIFQTTSSFVDEYVLSPESFIAKANPVTGLGIAILGEERAQKLYERTFISKGIEEFNFLYNIEIYFCIDFVFVFDT